MRWLGAIALACFAAHAAYHLGRHEAHDLLWTCTLACLLIGVSCLVPSRTGVAVGVAWLALGMPLWLLDLATGGALLPTTALTHLGGFATGALAIRRAGWPPGAWWKAVIALIGVLVVTRAVTPPWANVNLAFSVYGGWERYFPTYRAYFAMVFAVAFVTFLAVERVALRLAPR